MPGAALARPDESRLVAEPAQHRRAAPEHARRRSDGRGLRLRQGIRQPRSRRGDQGPPRPDDGQPGMVAGRLWPLRPVLHPHGLAQRRHLSRRRWPRRRRARPAALRAAQLLAGQRQPRQGAPPALADQAEVRPQDFLGRPHDPHRQRRARVDGLQDLRLRRRPRRHVGAGKPCELGRRGHLARRRALQRRPRTARPSRRRADGPHLRQSGRPERQARSGRLGARHPRDVRAAWR